MCSNYSRYITINGHRWKDVTNETTAGQIFSLASIVANNGCKPTSDSN